MHYPLSFSLIFFFFLFSLFHQIPCVSSKQGVEWCETLFQCGNITAGFPFWGGNRHKSCGHPSLELHCNNNISSLFISNQEFHVLQIDDTFKTLTLARTDLLGSFCSFAFNTTTLPPEIFELSPTYKTLTVLYHCDPKLSYRSSYTCPTLGLFSMSQSFDYKYSCQDSFNINVPISFVPEERELSLANLESALRKGFEVKLVIDEIPCQECLSSRGTCGFNRTTQICCNVTSPSGGVSCVPYQPSDTTKALKTLQTSPTLYDLKKALEEGFKLEDNSDCFECVNSGGACGYNHTSSVFLCYSTDGPHNRSRRLVEAGVIASTAGILLAIILTGSVLVTGVVTCLVLLCPCFGVQIFRKRKTLDDMRQEKLKALIPLKHYTYVQVKKITKSFEQVVGRGGFGIVYKGTLCDGTMVAVKVLKESKGNDSEDFINEVATMSQTSHVNIVSLLGFCCEGSKRAIVYELLGNGSLDKFISDKTSMNLNLTSLYRIALGIAHGLQYLHYGCKTRIVHFDIKPQNVLLDENLCPKVSDFGLAKLCEKKEIILSLLDTRRTIGYIAPEMISRVYGSVSHKSDVYSYGC